MPNTHNALIRTNNNGVGEEVANNLSGSEESLIPAKYDETTAIYDHAVGSYVFLNGHVYKVTSAISVGDALAEGTNIEEVNLSKNTQVYIENLPGGGSSKQQGYIIPASESATVDAGSTTTVPLTIIGDGAISVTSSDSTKATGSVSNGVLTITGVGGGIATITITMADSSTYLGTSATVSVASVPNGSTATPTNDIQTWLACASIFDKSYTTISDVLADSSTLLSLTTSDNAVDYLVRSTTWASSVVASENAMKDIGASDYASNTLLADSTWLNAICNSTYFESVLNVKVPTMTSNTTPSGEASASRTHDTNYPYKAFDNDDNNTCWLSTNGYYASGDWIQYMFVDPVCVKKVSFFDTPSNGVNRIKDYSISASNDGQSWDVIKTGTLPSTSKRERVDISLENNNSYKYWRLTSISAHSANAFLIYTLQFYGRGAGGVQDWLEAGGITDKTYTTLAEVLADTTTLGTLIASEDAMDYLVTATAFADAICANQTAMSLIGLNNYAANTLLADSTWLNAICNSTYFESVLNVKVPTMTSNTTPSGECFRDSQQTVYQAFYSFQDSDDGNLVWAYGASDRYIGYDFGSNRKIYASYIKVKHVHSSGSATSITYKVQEFIDNVWTDLSDSKTLTFVSGYAEDFIAINNPGYSNKFRIINAGQVITGNDYGILVRVQFYGREDV